jgi:N-acetylmuramoyl-L-alanine amidase
MKLYWPIKIKLLSIGRTCPNAALALCAYLVMPSLGADRVALVVGNNTYRELAPSMQLTSPVHDAEDVARSLSANGYTVVTGKPILNGTREDMMSGMETFAQNAKGADAAVFYYSGHGIQVGEDNYLLPSDTPKITGLSMLKGRALHLRDSVMVALEEAGVKYKVVILDCCRDNPFSSQLEKALAQVGKNIKTKSVGEITGYGPGFYLAFATSPGQTAADGNGDRNSPFTAAILKTMPDSLGKDIDFFFREVKSLLPEDQVSWTNHSITTNFPLFIETKLGAWEVVSIADREYVTGASMKAFYQFATHKLNDDGQVWLRNPNLTIKGEIGSRDVLINDIRIGMHLPVLAKEGKALFSKLDLVKTIEPVIRPNHITSKRQLNRVVIDPAFGGTEHGKKGLLGLEKNYTLSTAKAIGATLEKRGFEVVYTRENDSTVTLDQRLEIINQVQDGVCVSIQFASGDPEASGFQTLVLSAQEGKTDKLDNDSPLKAHNEFDAENITLGMAVHAQAIHRFKLKDLGVQRSTVRLLSEVRMPTIVVKLGYLTNPTEAKLINSEPFISALAEAFGDALVNYRRALDPNATPTRLPSSQPTPKQSN